MTSITTKIACNPPDSGSLYCPACCPDPDDCETDHAAVFGGAEVDCVPPTCDQCNTAIEGYRLLHHYKSDVCEHCNQFDPEALDWHWSGRAGPSYPAINVKAHSLSAYYRALREIEDEMRMWGFDARTIDRKRDAIGQLTWEIVQEQWWADALAYAERYGWQIHSAGRQGGWLIAGRTANGRRMQPLFDRDFIPTDWAGVQYEYDPDVHEDLIHWSAFVTEIKAMLADVDQTLADEVRYRWDEERPLPIGWMGGTDLLGVPICHGCIHLVHESWGCGDHRCTCDVMWEPDEADLVLNPPWDCRSDDDG